MTSIVFTGCIPSEYDFSSDDVKSVEFNHVKKIDPKQLAYLTRLERLESLKFFNCELNDEHVRQFPTTLRSLTLKNCPSVKTFDHLSKMTNLQELHLTGSTHIKRLPDIPPSVKVVHVSKPVLTKDERIKVRMFRAGNWMHALERGLHNN